jgi:transcriptional regulator with XRE-family HTH domain
MRYAAMTAAQRLGAAMKEARTQRHMSVLQLATAIGLSESATRALESGRSRNTRGETLFLVLAWAGTRGYRTFADWRITPSGKMIGTSSEDAGVQYPCSIETAKPS